MARRRPAQGGRPSKGEREPVLTRLPRQLADRLRDEADDQGLTYSDWLGNLVAKHSGEPPLAVPPPPEDQIPLSA